jgi:4-aminobutyrate aminotransferase-like enzyme
MEREDIPGRAAHLGKILREHLETMKEKYSSIGDVRGMGLMQALEFVKDRDSREPDPAITNAFLEAAKKNKLLLGKGGRYGNTIRIAPPMLISESDLREGCRLIDQALSEIS